MTPKAKKGLIASICISLAFVLCIAVIAVVWSRYNEQNKDTSDFELADVSSPTHIVSYVQDNTLQQYEYADVFPGSVTTESDRMIAVPPKSDQVVNVLAICTDEVNGYPVADMMMVVSFHAKTGEVRMISLGGDTYVPIQGHGWDKLCMTVAYGGPELAINTVNSVFDLDISQYVMLDQKDVRAFFEQVAPLEVEMSVHQAEVFKSYHCWDTNPGLNELSADQLTTMVSFRDYCDGAWIDGEKVLITDADRMENIRMVARAVFRSLCDLDFGTVSATLDIVWSRLDAKCSLRTVREALKTVVTTSDQERMNLVTTSLPALNEPTYVVVKPAGYEQEAVATLYNYESIRRQLNTLLYADE